MPIALVVLFLTAGIGFFLCLCLLILNFVLFKKEQGDEEEAQDYAEQGTLVAPGTFPSAAPQVAQVKPMPDGIQPFFREDIPAPLRREPNVPREEAPINTGVQAALALNEISENGIIAEETTPIPVQSIRPVQPQPPAPRASFGVDGETLPITPVDLPQNPYIQSFLEDNPFPVVGDVRVAFGNQQHKGSRREQQDAFAITPIEDSGIIRTHGVMGVVCDGMGATGIGSQAANAAVSSFMESYLNAQSPIGYTQLLAALNYANEQVRKSVIENGEEGAGATLVAAAITSEGLSYASVGDSHAYVIRADRIVQLNHDHNRFAQLLERVKAGEISLEEARNDPERAHLTSYLGMPSLGDTDISPRPIAVKPGDRILLCTDGLYHALGHKRMLELAQQYPVGLEEALLTEVLEKRRSRQDNITIVVFYCEKA